MRHARPEDLGPLEDLLAKVREVDGLVEKNPGTFYRRSKGFLHFHIDAAGIFADLKEGDRFERYRVSTQAEQRAFVTRVHRAASA